MPDILLACANAERIPLADDSVHVVVTSPPYYGLRAYKAGEGEIGLEESPELYLERMVAVFREVKRVLRDDGVAWTNMGDSYAGSNKGVMSDGSQVAGSKQMTNAGSVQGLNKAGIPEGLKPLDLMNIPARLVLALQADGWYHRSTIIWSKLNPMPESLSGWRWERCRVKVEAGGTSGDALTTNRLGKGVRLGDQPPGLFATWADCPGCEKCAPNGGLVLRRGSWRPTTSHEYIFMLTKTDRYFADGEAVREKENEQTRRAASFRDGGIYTNNRSIDNSGSKTKDTHGDGYGGLGRNARTVWTFSTQGWPGAHFATFPEELPRRCLKASTSERGCCPKCGAAWARVVEKAFDISRSGTYDGKQVDQDPQFSHKRLQMLVKAGRAMGLPHDNTVIPKTTLGWLPTCTCKAGDPVPMIILDPFCGSGTTGVVARELGHHFIGLDLSRKYLVSEAQVRLGLDKLRAYVEGRGKDGSGGLDGLPMFERGEQYE